MTKFNPKPVVLGAGTVTAVLVVAFVVLRTLYRSVSATVKVDPDSISTGTPCGAETGAAVNAPPWWSSFLLAELRRSRSWAPRCRVLKLSTSKDACTVCRCRGHPNHIPYRT